MTAHHRQLNRWKRRHLPGGDSAFLSASVPLLRRLGVKQSRRFHIKLKYRRAPPKTTPGVSSKLMTYSDNCNTQFARLKYDPFSISFNEMTFPSSTYAIGSSETASLFSANASGSVRCLSAIAQWKREIRSDR